MNKYEGKRQQHTRIKGGLYVCGRYSPSWVGSTQKQRGLCLPIFLSCSKALRHPFYSRGHALIQTLLYPFLFLLFIIRFPMESPQSRLTPHARPISSSASSGVGAATAHVDGIGAPTSVDSVAVHGWLMNVPGYGENTSTCNSNNSNVEEIENKSNR